MRRRGSRHRTEIVGDAGARPNRKQRGPRGAWHGAASPSDPGSARGRSGIQRDRSDPVPALGALSEATERTHQWYLAYVTGLDRDRLREPVCFTFSDGDKGCMTREEMLAHVLLHGAVHRGEAARILGQIGVPLPWDTLAVHLHRAELARRRMEGRVLATA
ncbi:DinB family protein [Aureimonas sp. AU40]|uniref:DinB family protein n=1 Tax=Aureimonas sp. AU40 TaxID=1637747 RepID=UPI0009E6C665|nr:DinB family protein [Aureimonas sp. AU40]